MINFILDDILDTIKLGLFNIKWRGRRIIAESPEFLGTFLSFKVWRLRSKTGVENTFSVLINN